MLPKAAQCNEIDGSAGRVFDKGMTGLMTVQTIAALVLAMVAAALAILVWRQRRALLRLRDEVSHGELPGRPLSALIRSRDLPLFVLHMHA